MGSIDYSIVMPCLNEERTLQLCIERVHRFFFKTNYRYEVIVADNGSTDNSISVAENLGAKVVKVPEKGYGNALRKGIEASDGVYVIMGDADDSYHFDEIQEIIGKLQDGYDLVMGNRFEGGICEGAMPWHHQFIGNPVLSFIGKTLFSANVNDFHCGLRGFSRDAYNRMSLRSSGMEFASEIVVSASLRRMKICEVPIVLYPDGRERHPHLRSIPDGWRHLILMCRMFVGHHHICEKMERFFWLVLLPLLFFFKLFIGDFSIVSSESMEPRLKTGEWIFVSKCNYGAVLPRRLMEIPILNLICFIPSVLENDIVRNWGYKRLPGFQIPRRGDIVVFRDSLDNGQRYVKRIVGMPGDTLCIKNSVTLINGNVLEEPYIKVNALRDFDEIIVPSQCYFVMGDNRNNSYDSRQYGVIPLEYIIGKTW